MAKSSNLRRQHAHVRLLRHVGVPHSVKIGSTESCKLLGRSVYLKSPNIAAAALGPGEVPLVRGDRRPATVDAERNSIAGRATEPEGVGFGRAAVILQRAE